MTFTLTPADRALLETIADDGPARVDRLAETHDRDREAVADRLAAMRDNALVTVEGDAYDLTESGRRVLDSPADGSADDRVDVPETVDAAIEAADPRADAAAALRGLYAFLRHWGDATTAELVDGVYSETPLGYDSGTEWWEVLADQFASLPGCESPGDSAADARPDAADGDGTSDPGESDDPGEADGSPAPAYRKWTFADTAPAAGGDGSAGGDGDGRRRLGDARGSVRHAVAELSLDEPCREAVRAAFAVVWERGEVETTGLREAAFAAADAGFDDPERWWTECVDPALGALPGVERVPADGDGGTDERWRYVGA